MSRTSLQILVVGSTGRTGRHVLEQGLQRGHRITAFARRPKELTGVRELEAIIHGDALNLEDVRKAVRGQDAVISAVGNSGIARNLITAMNEAEVRCAAWL